MCLSGSLWIHPSRSPLSLVFTFVSVIRLVMFSFTAFSTSLGPFHSLFLQCVCRSFDVPWMSWARFTSSALFSFCSSNSFCLLKSAFASPSEFFISITLPLLDFAFASFQAPWLSLGISSSLTHCFFSYPFSSLWVFTMAALKSLSSQSTQVCFTDSFCWFLSFVRWMFYHWAVPQPLFLSCDILLTFESINGVTGNWSPLLPGLGLLFLSPRYTWSLMNVWLPEEGAEKNEGQKGSSL
jgi:hypothetical protein